MAVAQQLIGFIIHNSYIKTYSVITGIANNNNYIDYEICAYQYIHVILHIPPGSYCWCLLQA